MCQTSFNLRKCLVRKVLQVTSFAYSLTNIPTFDTYSSIQTLLPWSCFTYLKHFGTVCMEATGKWYPGQKSLLLPLKYGTKKTNTWLSKFYFKEISARNFLSHLKMVPQSYNNNDCFTILLLLQRTCRGVWAIPIGHHLYTLTCTHQRHHHGPYTGHTETPDWSTFQSAYWLKEMSLPWDLVKRHSRH